MKRTRKPQLSEKEYLCNDGRTCPFCAKEGGVEGHHSFEYNDHEACLNVVCGECGEQYIEVYEFFGWKSGKDFVGNDITTCPNCQIDLSEEYIECLEIEGSGVVQGTLECPECSKELSAVFKLSRWELHEN